MTEIEEMNSENRKFTLDVDPADFRAGLASMKSLAAKPAKFRLAQVTLEFDGRFASFLMPGLVFSANAQGCWPGRASFSANVMLGLHLVPPTAKPVRVRTDTSRIFIDTLSSACKWQDVLPDLGDGTLSLAAPSDHLHMLEMLSAFSKDHLYQQGFQNHIRKAKAWRYRRVVAALEHLTELGVTYDDLAHLVEEVVKRRALRGNA